MRKKVVNPAAIIPGPQFEREWLDLEDLVRVEVTWEDPSFPSESALAAGEGPGWRGAEKGKQIIRIVFDMPRDRVCEQAILAVDRKKRLGPRLAARGREAGAAAARDNQHRGARPRGSSTHRGVQILSLKLRRVRGACFRRAC